MVTIEKVLLVNRLDRFVHRFTTVNNSRADRRTVGCIYIYINTHTRAYTNLFFDEVLKYDGKRGEVTIISQRETENDGRIQDVD